MDRRSFSQPFFFVLDNVFRGEDVPPQYIVVFTGGSFSPTDQIWSSNTRYYSCRKSYPYFDLWSDFDDVGRWTRT